MRHFYFAGGATSELGVDNFYHMEVGLTQSAAIAQRNRPRLCSRGHCTVAASEEVPRHPTDSRSSNPIFYRQIIDAVELTIIVGDQYPAFGTGVSGDPEVVVADRLAFPLAMVKSKAYLDPKNAYITNPNIGRSVSAEWLEDNLAKNRAKTDGSFQKFLAKHLNIEIGMNLRADRCPGAEYWVQQGKVPGLTLALLLDRCEVVDDRTATPGPS